MIYDVSELVDEDVMMIRKSRNEKEVSIQEKRINRIYELLTVDGTGLGVIIKGISDVNDV